MGKERTPYKILSTLLCAVLLWSLLPLHALSLVVPTGTAGTRDDAWIADADAAIGNLSSGDAWKDHLADVFYEAVQYDDSGSLNWANPGLADSLIWNGYEEGDLTANAGTLAAQQANANPLDSSHTTTAARQAAADAEPALDGTTYYVYSPQQLLFALRTIQTVPLAGGYTISIENDLDMGGRQGYDWPDDIVLTGPNTILGNNHTLYNLRVRNSGAQTTNSYLASGLIRKAETLKASNLTFKNSHVLGAYQAGALVGYFDPITPENAKFMELDNISVQDSLIMSYAVSGGGILSNGAGGIFGRRQMSGNLNTNIGGTMKNCNVQNSIITSLNHTGALTSALNYMDQATNCFAVGCTVISFGEHSGGLFSCISGVTEISNCFVDAQVYCKTDGGVLCGAAGNVHIYDCYSSGFVEGTTRLGGFIGNIMSGRNSTIINCYSTALVGLRSEGTDLGGFIGTIPSVSGYNVGLVNCYAAGEVGSARVSVDGSGLHPDHVGGFVGNAGAGTSTGATGTAGTFTSKRNYAAYCYYDKQTTAMREWNIGSMKNAWQTTQGYSNPTLLQGYTTVGEIGIVGVLTTDTTKAGTGLMSNPAASSAGFQGFRDMSGFYAANILTTTYPAQDIIKPALPQYFGWDYGVTDHYPELAVFSKANTDNASKWGQWADLVSAYSKSSTSGAKLDTWEKGLNQDTGEKSGKALDANIYDTVRDLTSRFNLTTEAVKQQAWYRTQTPTGANNTFATTNILNEEKDVLILKAGESYFADSFAPGIEWLKTEVKVGDCTATRQFRVTPTAGLQAGESREIFQPSTEATNIALKKAAFYDHADDVELYYTTAQRFANGEPITTGIYPDAGGAESYEADYMSRTANALTDRQKALVNDASGSTASAYFEAHGNDSYGGSGGPVDTNTGIDISFMSREGETPVDSTPESNSANGSRLFIYIRAVDAISMDGQIMPGSVLENLYNEPDKMNTFNGLALKHTEDQLLMVEYVWQLADGRLIYDAKLIKISTTPFSAKITAYDAGGLEAEVNAPNKVETDENNGLLDTDDALVDVLQYPDHREITDALLVVPNTRTEDKMYGSYVDENGNLRDPDQVGPEYGGTLIASWKVTNPNKTVSRLRVAIDSGRKNEEDKSQKYFETIISDPKSGSEVKIPYEYYRFIRSDNGAYYVQIETIMLTYTVQESADHSFFYLVFNKEESGTTDLGNPVDILDVSNHIQVEIELSPILEVTKRVTGTLGDQEQEFGFTVGLPDLPEGNTYDYYITHAEGSPRTEGAVSKGDQNLTMKHGDKLVIVGLPYGTSYTITETDVSTAGYMTFINQAATGGSATSGTLEVTATSPIDTTGVHTADRAYSYVNSRTPAPNTGISMQFAPFVLQFLLGLGGLVFIICYKKKRRRH